MTNRLKFGLIAPIFAIAALVGGLAFAGFAPSTAQASVGARFNTNPQDFPVLEVSNFTANPGCKSCWSPSISNVHANDTVAFVFYYHNTGDTTATNTRLKLILNNTSNGITANGRIIADNASAVYGTAQVSYASNVQAPVSLTFVGSEFYRDSSVDSNNPDALPNGQTGVEVAQAGSGVLVGDAQPDVHFAFEHDGQLVVRYRVNATTVTGGNPTFRVSPDSLTVNVGQVAQYSAFYDSDGASGPAAEQNVTNAASWNSSNSSIANSQGGGTFHANAQGSTNVNATYQNLSDSANLTVNPPNGCQNGNNQATLVINPNFATVNVGQTYHYQALYDSDGPGCPNAQQDVTGSANWSSQNTFVATLISQGNFRGQNQGTAPISVNYQGLTASASLFVNGNNNNQCTNNSQATLVINPPSATVSVGNSFQYQALYDSDGPGCPNAQQDVTAIANWSSLSPNIAIPNGNRGSFQGVSQGTAPITANYNGLLASATLNVTGGNVIVQPPVVITRPPTIITTGVVAGASTAQGLACLIVTPSIDVTELRPGTDFTYTTYYRNNCTFTLNNALLKIYLPNEADFLQSSNPNFIREGQKFTYPLGPLQPGQEGSVAIRGHLRNDAHLGETVIFTSMIEFLDFQNRTQNTTSYLSAVLGENINKPLSASISETLGSFIRSPLSWILLLLIIIALIIWAVVSRRRTHVVEKTSTTTVSTDHHDDPLRGLRNA